MKTSTSNLRQNVLDELEWDPSIDSDRIGVAVEKGVVVLSGHVRSLLDRRRAEDVVKRVRGVHAVANELAVDLIGDHQRDDVKIANAVEHALQWNVGVPASQLKVTVSKGWVTVDGEVPFDFQRREMQSAVEHVLGVRGLTNRVTIRPSIVPTVSATDLRRRLVTALHRYAQVEADNVEAKVEGTRVVLSGRVRSWPERDQVQDAAWRTPGVTEVDNLIEIGGA